MFGVFSIIYRGRICINILKCRALSLLPPDFPFEATRKFKHNSTNSCGKVALGNFFSIISIGNSMICSDIWHNYHE